MGEKRAPDLRSRIASHRRFRPGLILGAVVVVVVLVCIASLILYASLSRVGDDTAVGSRQTRLLSGLAPEPEVIVEEVRVEKAVEEAPAPPLEAAYVPGGTLGLAQVAERLIIRTGNISMVVEDTRAAQATIEGMVEGMVGEGAFVVSSDEYGGAEESQPHITMGIRVPAARFDEAMDRLAEMAVEVTSRNESAQDVTEEYVDLEARLESLEAARDRLLEIMQEARSTKDLLEAEQQLTQRETEIESIKGRMQYLEESARLSSIWIELQPYLLSQPVAEQWRPAETARRAMGALVDGMRGFADFLIFFAIALLPWLLVIGAVLAAIVLLVRWRSQVRRAGRAASEQAAEETAAD
jgi:hypothetical protein